MAEQAARERRPRVTVGPRTLPGQRIEALLGDLPQARRSALSAVLGELLSTEPPALSDPAWRALVDRLSEDFLADFDVVKPHFQQMIRLLQVSDRSLLQNFIRLYQTLRRVPLGSYPDLGEALRLCGFREEAQVFMRQFLSQLFVISLNGRLQLLYQIYLAGQPFTEDSTEDERRLHFQPLEDLAFRLVRGADPAALLAWLGEDTDSQAVDRFVMTLNKFHFDPYRINFRFTHHCNIQCAHCYNFSGPHMKSERIDTERMLRIVAAMPEARLFNMNLTGGEPFMYLDTVLALVGAARDAGVSEISIYTNGFFAKTEENGRRVLNRLKDAGFMNSLGRASDHIKVSAGVYHQEFLSFDTVINLIRVYREVFGKNVVVDYEVLEDRGDLQDDIRRMLQDKGVADLVDIYFRGITPVGRGAQFDPELKHLPVGNFPACGSINEIVFDPDGSVLPCCGMNFGNKGIAIGSIHDDSLATLLLRMENNPILQYIAGHHIGRIFEHLDKAPAAAGYANICNLCQHALGDLEDSEDLKRRLAPIQDFFPFWMTAERLNL